MFAQLKKKDYAVMAVFLLVSAAFSALEYRTLGRKDTAMLFIATVSALTTIYMSFKDSKKAVIMFIALFPVLVTARKAVYFDFLFLRITYETVIISFLFILNIKQIKSELTKLYKSTAKGDFALMLYVGVLVVFSAVSSIFSYNPRLSLGYAFISITVPVMFFLTVIAIFRKEDINNILLALVFQNDLSCLYGFIQARGTHAGLRGLSAKRDLITFGFHNINIFAGILILILPFVAEDLLYKKSKGKRRIFLAVSFFINIVALMITFTRGAWLAFMVTMLIVMISRKYKKVLIGVILVGLAGSKWIFGYILRRGTQNSITQNESAIARIQSLFTSTKIMIDYPFGIGGGNFAAAFRNNSLDGYLMIPHSLRVKIVVATYNLLAAHNLWLQIGVEYGIICVFAFFMIVLNRWISSIKKFGLYKAETASITAYIMFSFLTGVEFEHKGIITGALIIWLVFAMTILKNKENWNSEGAA